MNIEKLADSVDSIQVFYMAKNGHPVYELMTPSKPGYVSPSGYAICADTPEFEAEIRECSYKKLPEFVKEHANKIKNIEDLKAEYGFFSLEASSMIRSLKKGWDDKLKEGTLNYAIGKEEDGIIFYQVPNKVVKSLPSSEQMKLALEAGKEKPSNCRDEFKMSYEVFNSILELNHLAKQAWVEIENLKYKTDEQFFAENLFVKFVKSLETRVLDSKMNTNHLSMAFVMDGYEYQVAVYPDGATHLGIIDAEKNSVLEVHDNMMSAIEKSMDNISKVKTNKIMQAVRSVKAFKP